MTIRIQAASRLHFGLLSLPGAGGFDEAWMRRCYGSVGLMVQRPGLRLSAERAHTWEAEGPLAARVLDFANVFARAMGPGTVGPHRFTIHEAPAEHLGLGTGTQLGMSVTQALAVSSGMQASAVELGSRIGRGMRSSLGIHGFAQGGFLVDGGKHPGQGVAPLIARMNFPEEWRIVLVTPPRAKGLHGQRETAAFQDLLEHAWQPATTDALCRLVMLGMLPALAEQDWRSFGQALYEFNRRVGEAFEPIQGGVYADPTIADLVAFIRRQGVPGSGQSSWGPTVFAVDDQQDRAFTLADRIRSAFALPQDAVLCTSACNRGARINPPGWPATP